MEMVYLFLEMAPYLLLGFFIAGLLHAFVPQTLYRKWLAGEDFKSVVLSLLFGIPLPLCSCGVIPTAVSMRKEGASKGATTAFLIGTPQTGVDSIAATYSVLGLPFAILRPVAALVTGLFGGLMSSQVAKNERGESIAQACSAEEKAPSMSIMQKCKSAMEYGFSEMIQDIGRWLILGLVLAGLITAFVPDDFFVSFADKPALNMLLVLVIAIPMYVCATGSIPIAAALILKGLSPGAALVFLMAGPATNVASLLVLGKTLGRRQTVVYLISIIGGAIAFGLCADYLLPQEWFTGSIRENLHSACCHSEGVSTPWWQTASGIILGILLVKTMIDRFTSRQSTKTSNTMTFKVTGMMCNHCKAHVENGIKSVTGVSSVEVDLASGTASVEGEASAQEIIAAVKAAGYDCSEI